MIDIHLYGYEGKVFYIEKEQVVEIFIKSRVVVNAACFREENPNYTRPSIKESRQRCVTLTYSLAKAPVLDVGLRSLQYSPLNY